MGRDDDIALIAAAKERAEIVERYDRGRERGILIDEWEDPAYEIYHTTDRYGFIRDSRLPEKKGSEEKETDSKEAERALKWKKKVNDKSKESWDKYVKTPKFRERIHKGIPDMYRGEVWKRLLKVDPLKQENKGVYEMLKFRARTTSPDIRQIDLDVNRTYRNHESFRPRFGIKQTHLFHVLAAYSMYNTEVGYCQGMSQIAALLLMYMDEEEAFWALSRLLTDERHSMHGLFIPGFPKLLRFQEHLERVIKKFLPKIHKYMNTNMIPASLYAIKWFMQCFLDRTPFHLTLRLWDIFMLEGDRVLIPMAFTIFDVHKRKLLKMPMESFVHFLQLDLEQDFGLTDDMAIKELEASSTRLRDWSQPPKATDPTLELPKKPFGQTQFPTLQELEARQNAQIHLNDQPNMSNGRPRSSIITTQVEITPNNKPSNPLPKPTLNKPQTLTISTKRNSHEVEVTKSDISPKVAATSKGELSPEVIVTSNSDEHELSIQFSEESGDAASIKEENQAEPSLTDSYYEGQLEVSLSDAEVAKARSGSATPEFLSEMPPGSSHMYTRSAGFRVKSPTSPQASRKKSPTRKTPPAPNPRTTSLNYNEKHPKFYAERNETSRQINGRPTSVTMSGSPSYDRDSGTNPGNLSLDGNPVFAANFYPAPTGDDIEIKIQHEPSDSSPQPPESVPFSMPRSPGVRPFPVIRRTSQNEAVNHYPMNAAIQDRSPSKAHAVGVVGSPVYNTPVASQPGFHNQMRSNSPTYQQQSFDTFAAVPTSGARPKTNSNYPPPFSYTNNLPMSPTSPIAAPNFPTLPSRFVVDRSHHAGPANYPSHSMGRTKYQYHVITDASQRRSLQANRPDRYDYEEQREDDKKQVFI